MTLRIRTFLLLFFLLLIPLYSSMVQSFKDTDTTTKPIQCSLQQASILKDGVRKIRWRKLAMLDVDAVLDYDDAGANPRHDPRRRPGGGRP